MVAASVANLSHGQKKADTATAVSQADAARMLNVSQDSIQRAKQVQTKGTPGLIAAVQSGAVSVSAAADLAELSAAEQVAVIAKGEKEILATARIIKARRAAESMDAAIGKWVYPNPYLEI